MSLSRAQANQAGRLLQISCGAEHTLNLSREGEVYSFGSGNYCNVGQGGSNSH
jgi:alpha-tubulin suppressor-like RCC1 family protein